MKRLLLETSFSKIYMIIMIIITLLILGGYFSYAMFTVTKEKENAISIVTGNLTYKLLVDDKETNTLTVPSNSRKDFIVTLSNPNNRVGRFNFYYVGDLADGVDIGYIEKEGVNTPPSSTGVNLEKVDTTGSSNTYIVRVANTTESEISIELGVNVGLDYNDLDLPSDGHLLRKITSTGTVKEVIDDDIMNRLNYEDSEQTFVTGSNPYNYIWYSGKLWRVVSIDPNDNSVKLVTQWNISSISYDNDSSAFEGSYMEAWLNDTTVDGFLYNLREPDKFIKMDSRWNAMLDDRNLSEVTRPADEESIVEDPVGLLNIYEFKMSSSGVAIYNSYLNNGLSWWMMTPYTASTVRNYEINSSSENINTDVNSYFAHGIRPSINLKPAIKIVDGDGSAENPYRLEGDNDINLEGTLLNTRYSGEYITFGTGENNLYRIVSHETEGLTKIISSEPLKENSTFKTISFGDTSSYSSSNTIGSFLNGEYLNSDVYLTSEQVEMIEDSTIWYLGRIQNASYKYAKYTDLNMSNYTTSTEAKVGLLRYGELMAGQFYGYGNNTKYSLLSYASLFGIYNLDTSGNVIYNEIFLENSILPSVNLKQNIIITSGDGTIQNPFEIELAS